MNTRPKNRSLSFRIFYLHLIVDVTNKPRSAILRLLHPKNVKLKRYIAQDETKSNKIKLIQVEKGGSTKNEIVLFCVCTVNFTLLSTVQSNINVVILGGAFYKKNDSILHFNHFSVSYLDILSKIMVYYGFGLSSSRKSSI